MYFSIRLSSKLLPFSGQFFGQLTSMTSVDLEGPDKILQMKEHPMLVNGFPSSPATTELAYVVPVCQERSRTYKKHYTSSQG